MQLHVPGTLSTSAGLARKAIIATRKLLVALSVLRIAHLLRHPCHPSLVQHTAAFYKWALTSRGKGFEDGMDETAYLRIVIGSDTDIGDHSGMHFGCTTRPRGSVDLAIREQIEKQPLTFLFLLHQTFRLHKL